MFMKELLKLANIVQNLYGESEGRILLVVQRFCLEATVVSTPKDLILLPEKCVTVVAAVVAAQLQHGLVIVVVMTHPVRKQLPERKHGQK